MHFCYIFVCKGKSTVHHSTGHEGPEGEQRYSSTLSLTSALYGVSGQRYALATLPLEKRLATHCIGGLVGPQGRSGRLREKSATPGFDTRTVRLVASRYTVYTLPKISQVMNGLLTTVAFSGTHILTVPSFALTNTRGLSTDLKQNISRICKRFNPNWNKISLNCIRIFLLRIATKKQLERALSVEGCSSQKPWAVFMIKKKVYPKTKNMQIYKKKL